MKINMNLLVIYHFYKLIKSFHCITTTWFVSYPKKKNSCCCFAYL